MVAKKASQLNVGSCVIWNGEQYLVIETTSRHQRTRLALLSAKLNIVTITLARATTVNTITRKAYR